MNNVRKFEGGIKARVRLPGKACPFLKLDEQGAISVPARVAPTCFLLQVMTPENLRAVVTSLGEVEWHPLVLRGAGRKPVKYKAYFPHSIRVERKGENVWTVWRRGDCPNHMDCWVVRGGGGLNFFQIGVVTHNDGVTFRLLGEMRWKGTLYRTKDGAIVGVPCDPCWGPFGEEILEKRDFQNLLQSVKLALWTGSPEELDPPLGPVPGEGFARVKFYIPFAGQTGQGTVVLPHGSEAWVHGADLPETTLCADGVKRIKRGTLVRYEGLELWGDKKGPPRLVGITLA